MSLHNIALTVNCLIVDRLHEMRSASSARQDVRNGTWNIKICFSISWLLCLSPQGPTSYRPKFATTLCKRLSRHLSSCLWQEHSSDIVEGYELHRCIYDHLHSGTRLLFDCDRVILCFWQAEKHFSMELQSDAFQAYWWKDCFHLRLAPQFLKCWLFQISVNFMHTWGSRCTWVHNTWNIFDLPSRRGIELCNTYQACLLLAIAPPLRDTTGEAVSGADAGQPTATFLSSSAARTTPISKRLRFLSCLLEFAQQSPIFNVIFRIGEDQKAWERRSNGVFQSWWLGNQRRATSELSLSQTCTSCWCYDRNIDLPRAATSVPAAQAEHPDGSGDCSCLAFTYRKADLVKKHTHWKDLERIFPSEFGVFTRDVEHNRRAIRSINTTEESNVADFITVKDGKLSVSETFEDEYSMTAWFQSAGWEGQYLWEYYIYDETEYAGSDSNPDTCQTWIISASDNEEAPTLVLEVSLEKMTLTLLSDFWDSWVEKLNLLSKS